MSVKKVQANNLLVGFLDTGLFCICDSNRAFIISKRLGILEGFAEFSATRLLAKYSS